MMRRSWLAPLMLSFFLSLSLLSLSRAAEQTCSSTGDDQNNGSSCVDPSASSTSDSDNTETPPSRGRRRDLLSRDEQYALYDRMVDWIRSNGGIFDDRQTVRIARSSSTSHFTHPPQIYATEDIPEGTTLLSIPWRLIIAPEDPESVDLCDTVAVLSAERKKGEDSFFWPYLQVLLNIRANPLLLPDAWSQEGQEALKDMLGDKIGPQDVGRHAAWFEHYCTNHSEEEEEEEEDFEDAMAAVAYRSPGLFTAKDDYQETLIPMMDTYGHRSGDMYYNTYLQQVNVGDTISLAALRDISKGEAIYMSRGFGETVDTAELFRDHGILPEYPQKFVWQLSSSVRIALDIYEEATSDYTIDHHLVAKWENNDKDPPALKSLEALRAELERLEAYDVENQKHLSLLPKHELELLTKYHDTLVTAMTVALKEGDEGRGVWPVTDFTISHYYVAGVNLGRYGLAEEEEQDDDSDEKDDDKVVTMGDFSDQKEPFELFEDFDISHMIHGTESWIDMVKYRQSLRAPSLSFYVDKVARKRWLPTQGFQQATQYALHYKFELTESGEEEDEAKRLFELLPNQTDFAAKPTHHSETSGVWLVSHDKDKNSTMVSSTARQLIPDEDNTFDNWNVARGLAKNLQKEAASHESWVLKNVKPGVVIEERFVDFDRFDRPPLEFCIFTIWGRVWVATMNYVKEQERQCGAFVYRNGTTAVGSFWEKGIPFDYVDWPKLVEIAETLGAHKDMFRTDIFVGVPAGSPSLRPGASLEERKAAVRYVVSECELHPTTVFHTKEITDEGARLWVAGYKLGNYKTIPNSEVPKEFKLTGSLSSPETFESNAKIRDECRRHPTWREGVDDQRCAAATGYNPKYYDLFKGGTGEFPRDDLEWARRIVNCMDERASNRTADHVTTTTGPLPEPVIATMYPPEEPTVVIIENAFTEEEANTVEDLTMCMQKFHGKSLLEHRSFNYAGTGGNDCTFLGGFLQLFAPGVAQQMYHIGYLGWEAAGWATKMNVHDRTGEMYPFPDPRTAGLRTSGHLSYEGWEELGGHADDESMYDVLAVFAAPSDYEGGEFFLQPSTLPEEEENKFTAKPEKYSAVVFLSEEFHGVQKITGGLRKTWGNELWKYGDVPVGILRPRPVDWENFVSTGRWVN